MKRTITILCTFALLIAASSVAGAADNKWIIRGNYVMTWPSTDSYQTNSVIGDDSIFNELSLDSGQGFGLDIGYKLNPKMEVLVMAIFTDMEGTFVYGLEPGEAGPRVVSRQQKSGSTIPLISRECSAASAAKTLGNSVGQASNSELNRRVGWHC